MVEPAWAEFVGFCAFLAFAVVALSRASAAEVTDARARKPSAAALFVNVAVTHGPLLVLVVGAAALARIPLGALGVGRTPLLVALGAGVVAGVLLALGNELFAVVADAVGTPYSDALRDLLAPESPGGWVVLLAGVLPLVALAEELLFRGVLVGAIAAGFGTPAWALVAFSSVLFGLAHGAQGAGGVAVTTVLGALLAVAFLLTGSLLAVVVAHYLVNASEFVVHEALDRNRGS